MIREKSVVLMRPLIYKNYLLFFANAIYWTLFRDNTKIFCCWARLILVGKLISSKKILNCKYDLSTDLNTFWVLKDTTGSRIPGMSSRINLLFSYSYVIEDVLLIINATVVISLPNWIPDTNTYSGLSNKSSNFPHSQLLYRTQWR